MAQYRITYWKDIPSQVEAFDATARARRPLSDRFQELIDTAAMRQGPVGTDAYLEGWRLGPVMSRDGTPREVAEVVATEIEAIFEDLKAAALGTATRHAREQDG